MACGAFVEPALGFAAVGQAGDGVGAAERGELAALLAQPQHQHRGNHRDGEEGDHRAVAQHAHAAQVLFRIHLGRVDAAFGRGLQPGQLAKGLALAARLVHRTPLAQVLQRLRTIAQQGLDVAEQVQPVAHFLDESPSLGHRLCFGGQRQRCGGGAAIHRKPGQALQGHHLALWILRRLPGHYAAQACFGGIAFPCHAQDLGAVAGDAMQEHLLPAQPCPDRFGAPERCGRLVIPLQHQQRVAVVVVQDQVARIGRPVQVVAELGGFFQIRQCAFGIAHGVAPDHRDLHQRADLAMHVALPYRIVEQGAGQTERAFMVAAPQQQVRGHRAGALDIVFAGVVARCGREQAVGQLGGLVQLAQRPQGHAEAPDRAYFHRGGQRRRCQQAACELQRGLWFAGEQGMALLHLGHLRRRVERALRECGQRGQEQQDGRRSQSAPD